MPISASTGRAERTRQSIERPCSTDACQSVDFPIPGSPSSTNVARSRPARSRKSWTELSSASRPTTSTALTQQSWHRLGMPARRDGERGRSPPPPTSTSSRIHRPQRYRERLAPNVCVRSAQLCLSAAYRCHGLALPLLHCLAPARVQKGGWSRWGHDRCENAQHVRGRRGSVCLVLCTGHRPTNSRRWRALGPATNGICWVVALDVCKSWCVSCPRTPAAPGPWPSHAPCASARAVRAGFPWVARQRQRPARSSCTAGSCRPRSPGPGP